MTQINTPLSVQQLNTLNTQDSEKWFSQCCAAPKWFKGMAQARPFADYKAVVQMATTAWQQCTAPDFLIAFEAHPMIGDVSSLRKKYAATKNMASNEQQGASEADEQCLQSLASANRQYLDKHGFIFIICATGLSAKTMLDALTLRLSNDTATEITLAAAEQLKITLLRLQKGLQNTLKEEIPHHEH
ncbi:2-oxo-4-hydroxy-4-carboxy-5-ureidoimidazoline decarboxylase [uncultured Paraglaciecola sp.]|uniref:2-oxo-4-hydroxy-4-carboxy-5-ureidoimidazoline decarboxylase n=1 Tax=uncultured Paraglaciecola sp. TaxID=1765024 RepID=UPI00262F5BF9|nr:2-oxo-4-hydroxy-4-carboxy-5-ureidoimidazoline decarboxylase [uncultured Paraglaciecola sp.]